MPTEYDLFADVYDHEFAAVGVDLDFYLGEARSAQPPVLELACGTGRVTLPIAHAGIPIVGVDSSVQMLEKARDKVRAMAVEHPDLPVRWVEGDMREFRLGERFGLAIIPFRSFLHLLTTEDQVGALVNIRDHLLPEGKLALNLFVPDLRMIAEHSTTTSQMLRYMREFTDPATGARIAIWGSRRYDPGTQRIHQTYRYEELDDNGFVVATRYRSYTLCYIWPREMEHLLARCGFDVEHLYGWFDRKPFDDKSIEQVWVAKKL